MNLLVLCERGNLCVVVDVSGRCRRLLIEISCMTLSCLTSPYFSVSVPFSFSHLFFFIFIFIFPFSFPPSLSCSYSYSKSYSYFYSYFYPYFCFILILILILILTLTLTLTLLFQRRGPSAASTSGNERQEVRTRETIPLDCYALLM